MSTKIEAFLERLSTVDTLDDLQRLIECLRGIFDVEHAVYHSVSGTGEQYAALTYDAAWVEHYIEEDYNRLDPVVIGALKHFQPMDWKALDWSNRAARDFLHEAIDSGLGNQGYSVPIRGPNGQFALFTVNKRTTDQNWACFTAANASNLLLLAHYIHERANHINQFEAPETRDLSPRERDALIYLGHGDTRGRIAERMKISEHTLRVYIDSAHI